MVERTGGVEAEQRVQRGTAAPGTCQDTLSAVYASSPKAHLALTVAAELRGIKSQQHRTLFTGPLRRPLAALAPAPLRGGSSLIDG